MLSFNWPWGFKKLKICFVFFFLLGVEMRNDSKCYNIYYFIYLIILFLFFYLLEFIILAISEKLFIISFLNDVDICTISARIRKNIIPIFFFIYSLLTCRVSKKKKCTHNLCYTNIHLKNHQNLHSNKRL